MNANAITSHDVLARLVVLPPADLAGPALLARLFEMDGDETITYAAYIEVQPEIEKAIKELEEHAKVVRGIVKRCYKLGASPSQDPPAGF